MPTLVFVHGVGGAQPRERWTAPLETRLHQLDLPKIYQWFDTVIAPTYMPLSTSPFLTRAPQVTYQRPRDKELLAARTDFITCRNELERTIFAAERATGALGFQVVPKIAHAPLAAAAEHFPMVHDVHTWVTSAAARDRARAQLLSDFPTSGSVVIVAHSLGSVVAAGLLYYLPPAVHVDLLVTVGSPLSTRRYADHVRKIHGDFPFGRLRRWVNLYAPKDGITGGKGLGERFAPALDVRTSIGWAHDLQGYMSHPAMAAAIGTVMSRPRRTRRLTDPPVRRLHETWRHLLLSAAFAQTVSRQIPAERWRFKIRLDAARREAAAREVQAIERYAEQRAAIARQFGSTSGTGQYDDNALLPSAVPTVDDLVERAESYLDSSWPFDELLPFAVGLLMQPLARPFDIDTAFDDRVAALEHLIFRVRNKQAALPGRSDRELTDQIRRSLTWATKHVSEERKFSTGRVLLASSIVLLGATGVGLAVAAPAGLAGAAVLTATLASFGPGEMMGGLITLAALTGSVGAMGAAGVVALSDDGDGREYATLASADELSHSAKESLEVTLQAMLAVVHVQISLEMECNETYVRSVLARALEVADREFQTHTEFVKNGPSSELWAAKRRLLEKALETLNSIPGSFDGADLMAAQATLDADT